MVSWSKDRQIKKKEYADKVRHAASTLIAKIERLAELSYRFFDDIQPLITDTDILVSKEQGITSARDFLWRGLVAKHSDLLSRIVDEQIEMAYVDLYGYDPKVQSLFLTTIEQIKAVDTTIHVAVLSLTQDDVLSLKKLDSPPMSAQLGNKLRNTCFMLSSETQSLMKEAVQIFRVEMLKIITAKDTDIYNKKVNINLIDPLDISSRLSKIAQSSEAEEKIRSKLKHWYPDVSRESLCRREI